eukprot:4167785-Amphidinium_carterae.3
MCGDDNRTLHGNSDIKERSYKTSVDTIEEVRHVMENRFGQSIIQVDNDPAIKHLAEEAARELTIPWRQSSSHTHQGQGIVKRFHQTLFSQVLGTQRWHDQLPEMLGNTIQLSTLPQWTSQEKPSTPEV